MLEEQDRCLKQQKSNYNRSNECIICRNKTFRKDSKLYRLCETERVELFLRARKFNVDALFTKASKTVNFTVFDTLVKSKTERAELFLRARKLNLDAVFTEVSIFAKPVDLFAADIMIHR